MDIENLGSLLIIQLRLSKFKMLVWNPIKYGEYNWLPVIEEGLRVFQSMARRQWFSKMEQGAKPNEVSPGGETDCMYNDLFISVMGV
ncbi:hypothetical protein ACH5RR_010768 [Cinchona calisaya]|uniref:Uncharacterized protein n=1 Tax=Cinchona calisaya TaxID=153742 RepID=A0ABD3AJX2_9GENT